MHQLSADVRACFGTDRCAGNRKDPKSEEEMIQFVVVVKSSSEYVI